MEIPTEKSISDIPYLNACTAAATAGSTMHDSIENRSFLLTLFLYWSKSVKSMNIPATGRRIDIIYNGARW